MNLRVEAMMRPALGGVTKADGVPEGFMGLDCGPASVELNAKAKVVNVVLVSQSEGKNTKIYW